ncbi:MAG: SUMF1/EgtB/PvdO family nonheme iron enzyme [Planctomycetaceae bacterium]
MHSPDPRVRSYLIHRLSSMGVAPKTILNQLDAEQDITIRRALILSLGEFDESAFTQDDRKEVLPKLQEIYRTSSDPGLHAAAEWLLRTWKQDAWLKQVNDEWAKDGKGRDNKIAGSMDSLSKDREKTPLQWYVNGQGQTMVVIPGPVEFLMGSPPTEKDREPLEGHHRRRIGRSFAIAAKSVTVAEYHRLMKSTYPLGSKYILHDDVPTIMHNWFMAARYCNLLSREEGIPEEQWCYETGEDGEVTKLKENYLRLTGYRLPTEAEAEFANRAGAKTSRFYGETDELLEHYAWFGRNSGDTVQRVGTKKPNDFGFFDMQGSCYFWCQEPFEYHPVIEDDETIEDNEVSRDKLVVDRSVPRILRGGVFYYLPIIERAAYRFPYIPTDAAIVPGIRPARTLKSEDVKLSQTAESFTWPPDAPKPAIAPFDAEQAKKHQEEWAAHLQVPVEYTNSIGMKFRLIPPGEFMMGTTREEVERTLALLPENDTYWVPFIKGEAPRHKVILSQPVYLGGYEVTQAEYEKVMGTNPSFFAKTGSDPQAVEKVAGMDTNLFPVDNVTYSDAVKFCKKLNEQERLSGNGYQLPTEAQWEFACAAGATTRFWTGNEDQDLQQAGWFSLNSGLRSHKVGELKANPLGLYDVHGNVLEWVRDSWRPTFYEEMAKNPVINPSAPSGGESRMLRGGAWWTEAFRSRISQRLTVGGSNSYTGFRVALPVEAVKNRK